MENSVIEASYPLTFRENDAKALGALLKNRHSVVLIGMKRVGISNFLRFFLNHNEVIPTYISDGNSHLLVSVDLNDLVEREFFPFWILTLKRIYDSVEKSSMAAATKKYVEGLFLDSMQSKDTFLTIESIRKSLVKITKEGIMPTIFFIRFDRLKDIVTPELFGNLQGLRDAANQKLSYVFTSFRGLDVISPNVFRKPSLSVFAQNMFIKPANKEDIKVILGIYKDRYKLTLSPAFIDSVLEAVDGYVQYLQLSLISFHEPGVKIGEEENIFAFLSKDERIMLQSEELWESLNSVEQNVLLKIGGTQQITEKEKKEASYLWDTGFVVGKNGKNAIFSSLFNYYLKQRQMNKGNGSNVDLSKKEYLLFNFLKSKMGEICEREEIIQAVWSEVEELGVSDWAIDRLVARLRTKLRSKEPNLEIQTVKTRGYKMVEASGISR
ncbi:MAG: helix-turn-helix domain-containing protein [Candidatus Levybacteria bacterium]|nr:helix-turn-helix domain-containing protein [Candidatus Levybacteria bacterium]